ncbi:unnamed protein product, partial [Phaedon cochleariae]
SGVAALSCTDCSASSTSSSDITEPGSPFSTASTHSEDSGSAKMPPTPPQVAHHPPWPWTAEGPPPAKKAAFLPEQTIRLPTQKENTSSPPHYVRIVPSTNNNRAKKFEANKLQQGKITEYFKSQVRLNGIRKDLFQYNKKPASSKATVDQQTQYSVKSRKEMRKPPSVRKGVQSKLKKSPVPRKILPAPSNMPEKISINDQLNNIAKYSPTVTLTALSFPSNYTYLHAKTPKPPDASPIFVPQFTAIPNDKMPLLTAINNFNCVKLNATVVPIVKVNALPSRLNGSANLTNLNAPNIIPNVALSVETAVPTVLTAKPRLNKSNILPESFPLTTFSTPKVKSSSSPAVCRVEESSRTEEPHRKEDVSRKDDSSPTPTDSDSGISNKECLEVSISDIVVLDEQKSPILSKPKTIRFPAKQVDKDEGKSPQQSADGLCRWADCDCRFDTSGALLEHLQVKHVISQTTQEHYVCLWLGCKVHGRTSCSRSWLERHVLAHAGTKPFRCIVEGCGQRFNSQLMLERHVNSHFNSDGSPNTTVKKSPESGSCKLFKRNGKRIRFRRQPWSARMFDFIDPGIMEGLQHNLLMSTQKRTLGKISDTGDTVHLRSEVLARRVENDGSIKYLLRWHPADVAPDEWVLEKEYKPTRIVSIPHLDPSSKDALRPSLFPSQPRRKHHRKPISKQT